MASIEFIQKRISGKEKELEKLNKKLERILKAQSTNWEVNPYYYCERDLKYTARDIEDAQKALEGYKAQLIAETEKANSRDVEVIINFLNAWKERNIRFYEKSFPLFLKAREEFVQREREYCDWRNYRSRKDPNREEVEREWQDYTEDFRETWGFIVAYTTRKQNPETRRYELVLESEKLKKDLEQEANRKYDFIIERTNAIVGTITDASNLKIGAKDDLNGFIIGTKGTAKVQTIGAGGYNIQCFHFRTLINEMK